MSDARVYVHGEGWDKPPAIGVQRESALTAAIQVLVREGKTREAAVLGHLRSELRAIHEPSHVHKPDLDAIKHHVAVNPEARAADAFWQYWRENGETHKHGYYESTWDAINRAIRLVGVRVHDYGTGTVKNEHQD